MPFKSIAQKGWMHVHEPEIAKKWDKEYPNQGKLPKRASYKSDNPDIAPNQKIDTHAVDPAKLKSEVRKDLGLEPTGWHTRIDDKSGIKYAGYNQFKVIHNAESKGIYNTEHKAKEVLRKYISRGN